MGEGKYEQNGFRLAACPAGYGRPVRPSGRTTSGRSARCSALTRPHSGIAGHGRGGVSYSRACTRAQPEDRTWIADVVTGAFASTRVISRGRVHEDASQLDGFIVEADGGPSVARSGARSTVTPSSSSSSRRTAARAPVPRCSTRSSITRCRTGGKSCG